MLVFRGSQEKQLAILHPRLFSVYDIKKKETKETKVGDQVVLELVYQHVLRHSAHSFVLGFFGGVRGRQFICIQSLDGLLSFYEQESFSFQLYLPNFSFPYAFTYLEKTDSFLFLNGFLNFVCYSYESLASSGNEKSIMKMWEYSLGEGILDVQTVVKDVLVITVLTERNLYGLNENGNLIFAKRLEYTPIAFCTYLTEEEKKLMIVIGTDEQYINVYEETNLKWSMKINITPVSIKRIFLDRLPGGLVLLSEDGLLKCTYVGTHPSVYLVSPLHESELDLTKTEAELIDLQKKITSNDLRDSFTADLISVVVRLNKTVRIEENVRKCDLFVEIDTQFYVKRLQVLIQVENPLVSSKPNTFLTNFSGRTFVESSISLVGRGIPSCLMIEVIVSYITSEGIVGCINKSETLPLSLVLTETPPIKEAHYKFTVVTNQTVLNMNQIFREFATEDATPNAIGLKYVNSDDIVVTIVAAKSSQRFRIQSDSIPAVTLPFFTLIDRLKEQFRKNSDFQLTYSAPLPLDSYYEFIQIHHDLIGNKNILRERLFKQSSQYIMIQKKILSNLKDPAPKPFSNFHKLLMETSKMISCTLEELEKTEYDLTSSRCSLSSMNRLIPGLLELINIPENNIKPIKCLFNPFMYDAEEQVKYIIYYIKILFF